VKYRHNAALFGAVALGAFLLGRAARTIEPAEPKDPRSILGRVWLDKLPKNSRKDRELWIFLAGGLGIHEKGSWFRVTLDIFDFERQGNKITLTWLQDKKKAQSKFEIASCDDKPPFTLCLTLDDPPRGPSKLYSFSYDEDFDRAMPWAKDEIKIAEAKARYARSAEE
jgi:hypothetical protein